MPQPGVPQGEMRGPFTLACNIYPGTQHTYWVYVPAQFDATVPASLMIFQYGQEFKAEDGDIHAQHVMDNLIYRHEIPVMIGVFINPGRRPDQPEPTLQEWGDRTTNRPAEYNTPDDKYARIVVDELIAKRVARTTTFPRTPNSMGSAAPAPAPLPRSWSPGSVPTIFARY